MAEEYSVTDFRNAARRALEAGNTSAAEELSQAGIALQQRLRAVPAPARQSPHPDVYTPPDPQAAERQFMDANMLPPGVDPRTIPQSPQAFDPASMPAIDVPGGRPVAPGADVIRVTENGGYVMRGRDGALSYAGPDYATSDPAIVMDILRGSRTGTGEEAASRYIVEQNPIAARAATAVEGVPFLGSYGDEIAGAVAGEDAQRAWLASTEAMDTAYPGQAAALRTAGTVAGIAPVVASGPLSATGNTLTRGGQFLRNTIFGASAGAAEGAIYGFGDQEGGRGRNATEQAIIGGGLGMAAGMAMTGIDRYIRGSADRLRNQTVDVIQRELGVSPESAQLVREALASGEIDRALSILDQRGPQAMLAEASPALRILLNTQTKTDIGASTIARENIEREATRRYARLTETLDETMGAPEARETVQEGIMTGSRPTRSAAYDEAYGSPINYASEEGQRLESILRNRLPRGLIQRANDALREAGEESPQILARIADDGSVTFERPLSVAQIDYITRELQTMEGAARRAEGRTADASRYASLRREIRNLLGSDELVPSYRRALDAGQDAIAQREALDLGSRSLNITRGELRFELRSASEAERRMVARGLRGQIDDVMARAGAIASDPDVESREIRRILQPLTSRQGAENLREILGPDAARQVINSVEEARAGLELRAAVARNSDTAITGNVNRRQAELVPGTFFDALTSLRPAQARDHIVHALVGNSDEARQLRINGMAQEIAQLLTSQTGEGARRALNIINRHLADPANMPSDDARFIAGVVARTGVLSAYQQGRLALTPQ